MASALASQQLHHSIFEGVRRVVSIWNLVMLYGPVMGSRNKILGSGVTSYPTYLNPWVPLFGIFSLWRLATFVKMNDYLWKLNRLFLWIFSIDWYLNWPHWTFISWDMVHERVLCGDHIIIIKKSFLLAGLIDFEEIDCEKN